MSDTLIKVDAVYGMWQGERICEIMQYTHEMGHIWTTDTMLNYFDKLLECYDLYRSTNGYVSESFDEIEPLKTETGSNFNPLKHWKHSRLWSFPQLPESFPAFAVCSQLAPQ